MTPLRPMGFAGQEGVKMLKRLLFWKKKRRGRPRKKEPFVLWFPRLSAVAFVFCMFAFLASDFPKLIQNSPFMFNFFFGIIILSVVILTWRKNKTAGIAFVFLGITYALATWSSLMAVSSISTSLWLVTTGLLFIASDKNVRDKAAEAAAIAQDHKPHG